MGRLVTGQRYSPRRVLTTSLLFWARFRPDSSPFRFPYRNSVFTMNVFLRRYETPRLPSFSPHPRPSTTSPDTPGRTRPTRAAPRGDRFAEPGLRRRDRCRHACASEGCVSAVHLRVDSAAGRRSGLAQKHHHANLGQVMSDYFAGPRQCSARPTPHRVVAAVLSRHGFGAWNLCADPGRSCQSVLMSPSHFCNDQPVGSNCSRRMVVRFRRHRTSHSNWRCDGRQTTIWPDSISGMCWESLAAVNAYTPQRSHRFNDRFARFNLSETAVRPSYGLAEATVYVATPEPGRPPKTVRFEYEKLSAGHAKRCARPDQRWHRAGQLWPTARIYCAHRQPATPGWRIPPERSVRSGCMGTTSRWATGGTPDKPSARSAQGWSTPSPGTPEGPWLRTGDLGVMSDDELFIIGRIKDLLIVDGRNHYPDDIEATIQEITGGRVAAIAIPDDRHRAACRHRRTQEAGRLR